MIQTGINRDRRDIAPKEVELMAPIEATTRARQTVALEKTRVPPMPVGVIKSRPQTLLAVPLAAAIGLAVHYFVPKSEVVLPTNFYPTFLRFMFCLGVAGAIAQIYSMPVRRWMRQM